MIVKSRWRQPGGFGAHLQRNDTNEAVHFIPELSCHDNLDGSLSLLAALSRTNPKCKRSFIHIIISPDHPLTFDELRLTLERIATEHRIASDAPRAVVQHEKGARAAHFHVAYSVVDPRTGRAIKSNGNFETDELISRCLELQFGEQITPGPRLAKNIATLRARGLHREADILATYEPVRHDDPLDCATRQQAARLHVDPVAWSANVYRIFEAAGRNAAEFGRTLAPAGLSVAMGKRAILIVDGTTGHHESLVRVLRREAKKGGRQLNISEGDVRDAFPNAKPFEQARDEGLRRARDRAQATVDTEWSRLLTEAMIDADLISLAAYRAQRKKEADEAAAAEKTRFKASLKARRAAIVAAYKRRDRLRAERVDRVFRVARIVDTALVRRAVFALAAAGMVLAGAGIAATIAGAGLSVALLPTLTRARAYARRARSDRAQDRAARDIELSHTFDDVRRSLPRRSRASGPRFSFNEVPKGDRILAGVVARAIVSGQPMAAQPVATQQAAAALGPVLVEGLTGLLARGSTLQTQRLLHWSGPAEARDKAVAAALLRHASAKPGHEPGRTPPEQRLTKAPSQTYDPIFDIPVSDAVPLVIKTPGRPPGTSPSQPSAANRLGAIGHPARPAVVPAAQPAGAGANPAVPKETPHRRPGPTRRGSGSGMGE